MGILRVNAVFRVLPLPLQRGARRLQIGLQRLRPGGSNSEYWSRYNVTRHASFATREESLSYLRWRNDQYLFYENFLPFDELSGAVCLDFGCGPGHDVVALIEWSDASRVVGADVSAASISEARARLRLHDAGSRSELVLLKEESGRLPFADDTFDFIVSSGVLHHCEDPEELLAELRRVLKPGGRMRLMVYNQDSVFVHMHVAWERQILQRIDQGRPLADAFRTATDGETCPRSVAYTPEDWIAVCAKANLQARWLDAAVSMLELALLARRWDAIGDRRLAPEHRDFLKTLTFDEFGRPMHQGRVAGIDGLFEAVK